MKEQECYDREYHKNNTGSGLPDNNRPDESKNCMMGRACESGPATQKKCGKK